MKIIILFISIFASIECTAQTFREAFDKIEYGFYQQYQNEMPLEDNGDRSLHTNIKNYLHVVEAPLMYSYVTMYKATKDIHYLDKFIIHSFRVISRRDDNIQNINPVLGFPAHFYDDYHNLTCTVPDRSSISTTSMGWTFKDQVTSACVNSQDILHTGSITFPMADFIYLVLVQDFSNLHSLPVPSEVYSLTPNADGFIISNYGDYANWLRFKVNQSLRYFNDRWYDDDKGYYENGDQAIINLQCSIGSSLAMMYVVENTLGGTPCYASEYLKKVTTIATLLRQQLNINTEPSWYSWCYYLNCSGNDWEDISHGYIEPFFANICHQYNIPNYNNNLQLFWSSDMELFANTVAQRIYIHPNEFALNVYGTDANLYLNDTPKSKYYDIIGSFAFLAQYNPYLYQIINDLFVEQAVYPFYSSSSPDMNSLKAFANLTLYEGEYNSNFSAYENTFNPIAVKRSSFTNFQYKGVASGYFDGNNTQELITASSVNGNIELNFKNLDVNNNIINIVGPLNFSQTITAIASGDIASFPGDEFVIATDNGDILLYRKNGATISSICTSGLLSGNNITSIATGNFDGINGDEIILANNTDGKLYILKYDVNNGFILLHSYFVASQLSGVVVGNFDGTSNNEIATYNTSDNKIQIWKIDQSNNLILISEYSDNTVSNPQWNGISAGDFDGDGNDEIIIHREHDGYFFILKIKSNNLTRVGFEAFPLDQQNGMICTMHINNYPDKNALVTLRNYDGQITIFNMDGLCPNLYLKDQNINEAYTIDNPLSSIPKNNYPIDYHASNTLCANNFKVGDINNTDYSIVSFTAGKKIIVTPGASGSAAYSGCSFHAYIDQGIECSTPVFRINPYANANNVNNSIKSKTDSVIAHSNNIKQDSINAATSNNLTGINTNTDANTYLSVFPNPNNGNMQVSYQIPEKETGTFEVYDMMDKKILSYPISSGKNSITISRSDLEQGIYFYRAIVSNKLFAADKIVVIK